MRPQEPTGERLLRRAARSLAIRAGVGAAVLIAAVGLLALLVDGYSGRAAADRQLRQTAATVDDVTDPPVGIAIILRAADGQVRASRNTPASALEPAVLDRPLGMSSLRVDGGEYRVFVARRPDGVRLVALADGRDEEDDRHRLLVALVIAGSAGVAGAVLLGRAVAVRAVRPLGEVLALQRRFVADASHELRAPLTVLHTPAQLLAADVDRVDVTDPLARTRLSEGLDRLVGDSRALGELVEDLLLSAELPQRPAGVRRFDMGELAADTVASFSVLADRQGVTLDTSTGPGTFPVAGAPAALRRALTALVDNALSHTPAGGTITVQVASRTGWVILTVSDTGFGLDPTLVDTLFDRHVTAGAASRPDRRFGLGLALVNDVVMAHAGHIAASGTPGGGATFTLELPASPA